MTEHFEAIQDRSGAGPANVGDDPFLRIAVRKQIKTLGRMRAAHKREDSIVKVHLETAAFLVLLLVSVGVLSDASTDVLMTDDWSAEAAEARRFGTPILILFSDEDCGYCELLKKDVLEPLVRRSELRSFARIRELDIDRGGKIRDFDGEKIRTRIFVNRYGIYATPTLMLVDNRGNPLGTPIVGFNNREDYIPYLEYFMEVAYWEPQKLELPCQERFGSASLDQDLPIDAVEVAGVGDPWSPRP